MRKMKRHYLLPHINYVVCSHLLDVIELLRLKREGVNLRAHGFGPEYCVVPQPANADNTDLLARAAAVCLEWRVNGEAGAEHRCGMSGLDLVRDREDKTLVCANGGRVPALSGDPIVVLAILPCRIS